MINWYCPTCKMCVTFDIETNQGHLHHVIGLNTDELFDYVMNP
jgi:hypothetical protein